MRSMSVADGVAHVAARLLRNGQQLRLRHPAPFGAAGPPAT